MMADPAAPKDILRDLSRGATFDRARFRSALEAMSRPEVTMPQQAAFLALMRGRGETVEEITGAAILLRETMLRIEAPVDAIDIVGTGGDGHGTFNVSTCAAFVAAGCGLKVAKHGNRAVSSKSGSADVLEAFGKVINWILVQPRYLRPVIGYQFDVGKIASDLVAKLAQHFDLMPDLVHRAVDVPHVCMFGNDAQADLFTH